MAKYITPTLTITSNKYTASSNPGPMSSPLSLSVTDLLDVTEVQSKIIDMTTDVHQIVWDASDYTSSGVYGEDGGYLYFRNLLEENSPADKLHDIIIGIENAALDGDGEADRVFTLQPGEFAWFPWDMTQDIYIDSLESNTGAVEAILFVRTGTA